MATLIYQQSGSRRGGVIDGRVLIGRRLPHGVTIDDPAVSRLHAWIDRRNGSFVLTDAGSRTGTFVNGEGIVRCQLKHGDQIRVGSIDVTFSADDGLPAGVEKLSLVQHAAVELHDGGVLFYCKCGAPLWVSEKYAGKRGVCRFCEMPLRVPKRKALTKSQKISVSQPLAKAKCGVCHSSIDDGEATNSCPDCGTTFHLDCWTENYGCSSYGCPQVNSLQSPKTEVEDLPVIVQEEPPKKAPWDLLLLAGGVVGSVIGALLFGAPAIIVTVVASARLISGRAQRRGVLALALILSILGVAGGLALSDFWWFSGRHLSMLQRLAKRS
jgi:hypothetical protein